MNFPRPSRCLADEIDQVRPSRKGAALPVRAFTLIELLLAIVVFAVVLAAIDGVFHGAIKLRQKTTRLFEERLPLQHTVTLMRRDLFGIVAPGGALSGNLKSEITEISSEHGQQASADFYTTTGVVDEAGPWGEVQKVAYFLRQPTNRVAQAGMDLVRVVTRNVLASAQEDTDEQWLMGGVERLDFSYYDGTQWRSSWDSTTEETVLPKAIKVELLLSENDEPGATRGLRTTRMPLQLVVPMTVAPNTNQTQTTGGGR